MKPIIKDAFLELVKCGLWSTEPKLSYFSLLTEEDWELVYFHVQRQSVIGVCFATLELLPADLWPPPAIYLKWFGQVLYVKVGSCRMRGAVLELIRKFGDRGIYPILMKGLGVASWYARPELRMTGDIDLYIPEHYNEAVTAIEEEGFAMTYMPNHDKFEYKDIWVEMHHQLIRFPLSKGWEMRTAKVSDNFAAYCIPDADTNALLLLSHAAKHLIGPGIGIRHLCDWAVFLQHNYQTIHFDQLWRELKLLGLERFAIEFTALAHHYLGMDFPQAKCWYGNSKKKLEKRLLDDLMERGDCGRTDMEWRRNCNWFVYYAAVIVRLLKFHVYCPRYVKRVARQRVITRMKFVFGGNPFGNSFLYNKERK